MIDTLNINIFDDISSPVAVSTDDGTLIFNKIEKAINNDVSVNLDFKNIDILTSAFLNAAIGQLYSKFSGNELNEKVNVVNISEEDKSTFIKVVKRAKEYFINKEKFNSLIDSSL